LPIVARRVFPGSGWGKLVVRQRTTQANPYPGDISPVPGISTILDILLGLALFATLEAGRRVGMQRRLSGEKEIGGFGALDGAIYGLMGLLIAFTFSGAASRFDNRRELIIQETNAIGTAYLRLDLMPAAAQPQLRADFKSYLDARLDFYRNLTDHPDIAKQNAARVAALQNTIWSEAVTGSIPGSGIEPASRSLVLSSLNEMIDITATRALAMETHPPIVIYYLLILLVLVSSLLAGYEMAARSTRSWLHLVVYSFVMAAILYVTIDLEHPRSGFVRVDAADHFLVDLRSTMK
jgi:hypothetical protein